MANDNSIKTFTAADIEKYHTGQLSSKEMHDLEKAALDDPFLADALEGYSTTGININADIKELKKRLEDKTQQAKVIPMHGGGRSSFPWLRAAVMIVLIAGAGLLSYQFLFKNGSSTGKSVAESKTKENVLVKNPDSLNTLPQTSNQDSVTEKIAGNKTINNESLSESKREELKSNGADANQNNKYYRDSSATRSDVAVTNEPATSVPAKYVREKTEYKKLDDVAKQKADVATGRGDIAAKEENKNLALKNPVTNNNNGLVAQDKLNEVVVNGYASKRKENFAGTANLFRGRVTDANNTPLPFANVTNTRDNVGTYSDAQGNFTLVSPDTVLNVQVRSLGFENNNVQLRGYVANNQVMLQEDRSLNAKVLDTVKRNFSRARNTTMTFDEPEPADGWSSYGAYVVNNLNIPDTYDMKKNSETTDNTVEVSFEVNKNGDPVNLKVEKSLCDKCDKEAMRLIKEGPKWKRKAKKGKRTTVTVPFIKVD